MEIKWKREWKEKEHSLFPQISPVCPSVCGVSTAPGYSAPGYNASATTPSPAAAGASASTLSTSRHAASFDTLYAVGVNAKLAECAATLVTRTKLCGPSALFQQRQTVPRDAPAAEKVRVEHASEVGVFGDGAREAVRGVVGRGRGGDVDGDDAGVGDADVEPAECGGDVFGERGYVLVAPTVVSQTRERMCREGLERAERSEAVRELMARPLAPAVAREMWWPRPLPAPVMRGDRGCGGRSWREGEVVW